MPSREAALPFRHARAGVLHSTSRARTCRPTRARRQPCARARYFRNAGVVCLCERWLAAIAEACEVDHAAVVCVAALGVGVVRYSARNPCRESAAACGTDLGPMQALDRACRRQGMHGRVRHVPDSARSPRHISGRVCGTPGTGAAGKIAHKQAKCPQGVRLAGSAVTPSPLDKRDRLLPKFAHGDIRSPRHRLQLKSRRRSRVLPGCAAVPARRRREWLADLQASTSRSGRASQRLHCRTRAVPDV